MTNSWALQERYPPGVRHLPRKSKQLAERSPTRVCRIEAKALLRKLKCEVGPESNYNSPFRQRMRRKYESSCPKEDSRTGDPSYWFSKTFRNPASLYMRCCTSPS